MTKNQGWFKRQNGEGTILSNIDYSSEVKILIFMNRSFIKLQENTTAQERQFFLLLLRSLRNEMEATNKPEELILCDSTSYTVN